MWHLKREERSSAFSELLDGACHDHGPNFALLHGGSGVGLLVLL